MDLITLKRRVLTARHAIDAGNQLSTSNLVGGSAPTISVYNESATATSYQLSVIFVILSR